MTLKYTNISAVNILAITNSQQDAAMFCAYYKNHNCNITIVKTQESALLASPQNYDIVMTDLEFKILPNKQPILTHVRGIPGCLYPL